jgi:predicted nuclease of predicted toxin-antitoxin system
LSGARTGSARKSFRRQSVGRTLSLLDDTLLCIDDSLSPNVAEALRLVGYNVATASNLADFEGRSGVSDEEIIDWCHHNNAVWVHADDQARREHRKRIIAKAIRTLWVYRPRGKMSTREQLRILAYVLPDLLDRYRQSPKHKHYRADAIGHAPRTRVRLSAAPLE